MTLALLRINVCWVMQLVRKERKIEIFYTKTYGSKNSKGITQNENFGDKGVTMYLTSNTCNRWPHVTQTKPGA